MRNYTFQHTSETVNAELLTEELRALVPDLAGVSTVEEQGKITIVVHVPGEDAIDEDALRDVVRGHDGKRKSALQQQRETKQTELTDLEATARQIDLSGKLTAADQEAALKFLLARALATD